MTTLRPGASALLLATVATSALAAVLPVVGGPAQAALAGPATGPVPASALLTAAQVSRDLDVAGARRSVSADSDYGLSACTGETRLADIVGRVPRTNAVYRVGHDPRYRDVAVEQSADVARPGRAARDARSILEQVGACRHEPRGHWHYGPFHEVTRGAATATWMVAVDGDGSLDGGYVVARSGSRVATIEATAGYRPAQLRRLAADALQHLGS